MADAVADCTLVVGTTAVRHRELQHPLRRLEDGARLIRKQLASGRVALLFGSEKVGLANDDLSHCHWLLHIPTREEHISMNLGQAVAVCLYELVRDAKAAPSAGRSSGPARARQSASRAVLLEALHASGYVNPGAAGEAKRKCAGLSAACNLTRPMRSWCWACCGKSRGSYGSRNQG